MFYFERYIFDRKIERFLFSTFCLLVYCLLPFFFMFDNLFQIIKHYIGWVCCVVLVLQSHVHCDKITTTTPPLPTTHTEPALWIFSLTEIIHSQNIIDVICKSCTWKSSEVKRFKIYQHINVMNRIPKEIKIVPLITEKWTLKFIVIWGIAENIKDYHNI